MIQTPDSQLSTFDIIRKNRAAFEYWLDHGQVLVRISGTWEMKNKNYPWRLDTDYVIPDKFVEFRKALVEGKTIQANTNTWVFPETNKENWVDLEPVNLQFIEDIFRRFGTGNLRVKPTVPFKVGDFVRHVESKQAAQIMRLSDPYEGPYSHTYETNLGSLGHEDLTPWEPVENELCYFWSEKNPTRVVLTKFKKRSDTVHNKDYIYGLVDGGSAKYCEPFLNQPPRCLKITSLRPCEF